MRAKAPTPLALLIADLHISPRPPASRGETREEWFAAQRDYFREVKDLQHDTGAEVVIIAGDVCEWDSSPELINFLLREMPHAHAVPGNHDLPNHNYDQIHRSAYWTLCQSGVINNLSPYEGAVDAHPRGGLWLTGFPPGFPARGVKEDEERGDGLHVAVVHDYCWKVGHSFPGAPPEKHASAHAKAFRGFDVVVFGDNHRGFVDRGGVYNCGTFLRRTSDEKEYRPRVGVLYDDGSVAHQYLDTSRDKFVEVEDAAGLREFGLDPEELLNELRALGDVPLNFEERVRAYLARHRKKIPEAVAGMVGAFLEKALKETQK